MRDFCRPSSLILVVRALLSFGKLVYCHSIGLDLPYYCVYFCNFLYSFVLSLHWLSASQSTSTYVFLEYQTIPKQATDNPRWGLCRQLPVFLSHKALSDVKRIHAEDDNSVFVGRHIERRSLFWFSQLKSGNPSRRVPTERQNLSAIFSVYWLCFAFVVSHNSHTASTVVR